MRERALEWSRATVERLLTAALAAVEPERAVARALTRQGDTLVVAGQRVSIAGGVQIIAVGKAAMAMTRGALDQLDDAIISGDVITKVGHVDRALPAQIHVHEAAHPILDERSIAATHAALAGLQQAREGATVIALISGGGSALLEAPQPGLTLADFAATTNLLLRAGAPIEALNAVRSPLSRVKGGGLRRAAPTARWLTLILSDVLSNDPRVIASGPTVAGLNDHELALRTLEHYGLLTAVPPAVIAFLQEPAANDDVPSFAGDIVEIIGDNALAVNAAAQEARQCGLRAQVVWHGVEGEAAELGRAFVREAALAGGDVDVLLGGGEATVTVRGSGDGGRNTEFALAAALDMEQRGLDDWVVASLGTDGQDAMTGLAGAIADVTTASRSRDRGLDPTKALVNNDSATVFRLVGGAVETGPTGTNVNDLYIAVRLSSQVACGAGG